MRTKLADFLFCLFVAKEKIILPDPLEPEKIK